jgi:pimeloyl-ACP methyl ester carboxylesterase
VTPARSRGVALLVVLAFLLVGCSSGSGNDATAPATHAAARPSAAQSVASRSTAGRVPSSLAGFYDQKLDWKTCQGGGPNRCARMRVPLDYAHPHGKSVSLAVLKVPALEPGKRIGSMVINPGGPGESGVEWAASASAEYGTALRDVYDVVGFDPRGVGSSDPVQCLSDDQLDRLVSSDPDPETAAARRRADQMMRAFGEGCLEHSGDLARHVSTEEVAKDLDILRAVLGDAKLTYFGASYGTAIGASYADQFPKRVGRMVLDGALDPTSSAVDLELVQAHGFEVALRAYVGACVQQGHCFLGSTVDQGVQRIQDFLTGLEARPIRTSSGEEVTAGIAVYGLLYPLYDHSTWSILDKTLQTGFSGDGTLLRLVADSYLHRNPDGTYRDNSFQVFNAVNCLDDDEGVPSSKLPQYLPRFDKASPTFGRIFASSLTACRLWPIHSGRTPHAVHAKGSPPILVVGTTRDPATPLVWARSLARQLDKGVLVTRDGDGHTGYNRGSPCVDRTVEDYLVHGTVPKRPVHCR